MKKSPNGDGLHDFLHIQDLEYFTSNEVYIYNKNGQVVYNVKDYDNSDLQKQFIGQNNGGEDLPNGTYYFHIQMVSAEGKKYNQTGFFVLSR